MTNTNTITFNQANDWNGWVLPLRVKRGTTTIGYICDQALQREWRADGRQLPPDTKPIKLINIEEWPRPKVWEFGTIAEAQGFAREQG